MLKNYLSHNAHSKYDCSILNTYLYRAMVYALNEKRLKRLRLKRLRLKRKTFSHFSTGAELQI